MGEGFPFADIIVIAAVAAFILLRYRGILGQKKGLDFSERPRPAPEQKETVVRLRPQSEAPNQTQAENSDITAAKSEPMFEEFDYLSPFSDNISQIKAIDTRFRLKDFLEGAQTAFEMVVQAYDAADRDTLTALLDKSAYREFDAALKDREKSDTRTQTTLVAIKQARIEMIGLQKTTASITVRFVTEQIIVERDSEGQVISGDASRVQDIEDVWVFERDMRSRNPNWQIVST